jgi:rRNA maturation RNase YbeY
LAINFFSEDIDFVLKKKSEVKSWIIRIVSDHSLRVGNLNFIFCSDNYILDINQRYLNHNYFTDIITFNYNSDKKVSGDIFISIDTIKSNSESFNVTFEEELRRVIIHGVLHLIGFDDITDDLRNQMRMQEDLSLSLFPGLKN